MNCSGGKTLLKTSSWAIELNGQNIFTYHDKDNLTTKVKLGSKWYPTSRNPGKHVRNRYGSGIFKHAEHWMEMGHENGWQRYDTNNGFSTCPDKSHHACLDNHDNDGNIQYNV